MSVGVVWRGFGELEAELVAKVERASVASREAVLEAAHLTEAAMKTRAGEGGRHKQGTPTPASPGGGPAVITGTLRRSIMVGDTGSWGTLGYRAKVGPTAIYGRRVELEYDYPYTRPGLEDVAPSLPAVFVRAWARALTK